jgi:DNA repair protein RadC
LLEQFGGLEGLCRVGPPALADHPGLNQDKALRIAAALELGRRTSRRLLPPSWPLRASTDVAKWFTQKIGALEHEEMWVIALDGRNGVRGTRKVSQGGLHGCSISARDILRLSLADAAAAVILVHNHPSGEAAPSPEDIGMTRKVRDAAAIVGVPLLDHVIVTAGGNYSSMLDLKIL